MSQFLKDYGAAVGPFLGFLFGLLAVVIHRRINDWITRRRLPKALQEIADSARRASQPLDEYVLPPKDGRLADHGYYAKSHVSLNRLTIALIGIQGRIVSIEKQVFEAGETDTVERYCRLKWLVEKILNCISEIEDRGDTPTRDYGILKTLWERLIDESDAKRQPQA
ncbi:MAG: hypothetical protein ACRELZ_23520 [Candidatus Rokuibacteriota bacterium]